jgi:hypothetical protein
MSPTSRRTVESPADLQDLQSVLQALSGQPFLAARTSYGDELRLDFGRPVPYGTSLLAHYVRGEWVLGIRASPWRLTGTNDHVTDLERPSGAADTIFAALVGERVTDVRVSYPDLDLRISFNGGQVFTVPINANDESIAAWELFTPDHVVVRAGPGRQWSVSPTGSGFQE